MIEVVVGPMFSGKTEELIRRVRRAEIAGKSVVVLKHKFDDRYDTQDISWVASHNGNRIPSFAVHSAREIAEYHDGWDVIGIDEAQFFDYELTDVARRFSDLGMQVLIAGLDMTYRREPFGSMPFLLAIADRIDKLTAICHICGDEAGYTQRLVDGNPAPFNGPTVEVGAQDRYEARCTYCFEPGF